MYIRETFSWHIIWNRRLWFTIYWAKIKPKSQRGKIVMREWIFYINSANFTITPWTRFPVSFAMPRILLHQKSVNVWKSMWMTNYSKWRRRMRRRHVLQYVPMIRLKLVNYKPTTYKSLYFKCNTERGYRDPTKLIYMFNKSKFRKIFQTVMLHDEFKTWGQLVWEKWFSSMRSTTIYIYVVLLNMQWPWQHI